MRYHNDYDYDYSEDKDALQKNCKKDLAVKRSRCKQTNNVHVYVNDDKESSKYCKPKENKKFGCCCDTDSLRDLLLLFRQNNTPIFILTETFPTFNVDNGDNGDSAVFVNSIVGNLVYVSRTSSDGPVIALIPLCEIDYVIVLRPAPFPPVPGLANLINEIMAEPTLEKEDCCCIKGIGNTINSVSNISLLFPVTNAILLETNGLLMLFILITVLVNQDNITEVANDDLYILFFESQQSSFYFITPICNIDSLAVLENIFDGNEAVPASTALSSLLPNLNKDMKEKLKNMNMDKLSKEIKGMPLTEALKKINSLLS